MFSQNLVPSLLYHSGTQKANERFDKKPKATKTCAQEKESPIGSRLPKASFLFLEKR